MLQSEEVLVESAEGTVNELVPFLYLTHRDNQNYNPDVDVDYAIYNHNLSYPSSFKSY